MSTGMDGGLWPRRRRARTWSGCALTLLFAGISAAHAGTAQTLVRFAELRSIDALGSPDGAS